MKKIILDLCGGTGSWSQPYRDAGFEVLNITLPEFDVTKFEIQQGNILVFPRNKGVNLCVQLQSVYGILAAPPCTMFSRARTTARTPRDFKGAMKIVSACLEIVWACRSSEGGVLKFWALENPMGFLRQFLGKPPLSFKGYEFGDNHRKFTDIWGYYEAPKKKRGAKEPVSFNRKKWASAKKPEHLNHLKLSRADVRAITPQGFAQAFFNANK